MDNKAQYGQIQSHFTSEVGQWHISQNAQAIEEIPGPANRPTRIPQTRFGVKYLLQFIIIRARTCITQRSPFRLNKLEPRNCIRVGRPWLSCVVRSLLKIPESRRGFGCMRAYLHLGSLSSHDLPPRRGPYSQAGKGRRPEAQLHHDLPVVQVGHVAFDEGPRVQRR